jgi:uncharacterized protein (DUF1499 family)
MLATHHSQLALGSRRTSSISLPRRSSSNLSIQTRCDSLVSVAQPVPQRRLFPTSLVELAEQLQLRNIGAAPAPATLGVHDFGYGVRSLALCGPASNAVCSCENPADVHYLPPLTYNPPEGRGAEGATPASREQAMRELVEVLASTTVDGYAPSIVRRTDEYVHVVYTSSVLGFIDDVEFWFPGGVTSQVEYRSASRAGDADLFKINRKRVRALREALQRKGWASTGY